MTKQKLTKAKEISSEIDDLVDALRFIDNENSGIMLVKGGWSCELNEVTSDEFYDNTKSKIVEELKNKLQALEREFEQL